MKKAFLAVFLSLLIFLPAQHLGAQEGVRVALLPLTLHTQEDLGVIKGAISKVLSTRLMAQGDLVVLERSLLDRFLADLPPGEVTEREARWVGRRVGAHFVIFGSLTKVGDYVSLDLKVLDVTGETPTRAVFGEYQGLQELMAGLDSVAVELRDRILGREVVGFRGPGTLRASLLYQAIGYTKLQRFPGRSLKGVEVGDVDGDRRKEIVLMEPHSIWVYRDTGRELKLLGEFRLSVAHNLLTLGTIDVDGDGKEEIAVTDVLGDDLQSFLLSFEGGKFKYKAKGLNRYLCVKEMGGRKVLLAQAMGGDTDFSGPVEELVWKKGKLRMKGTLKGLPGGPRWLYSFVLGHFTGGERPEMVYVNSLGELRLVTLEGDQLWKTSGSYCRSDNYFDRPEVFADEKGLPTPFPRRVYLPTRMLARDLDADGVDELVVLLNRFSMGEHVEKVRIYDKGHVLALVWDGMAMAQAWRTQDLPGCIFDFQIADSDNDGREELVAVVVSSPFLKRKTSSNLLVFELYE
ncbi:MAG: hypothetical protein DRG55_04115 [Deltaproteobacteria bacterium]|nr:MAG: hypothetical protein DRG55_04115 [Deltaproteobacteria bacterium]